MLKKFYRFKGCFASIRMCLQLGGFALIFLSSALIFEQFLVVEKLSNEKIQRGNVLQSLLVKFDSAQLKLILCKQQEITMFYNCRHKIMKHLLMFICGLDSSQVVHIIQYKEHGIRVTSQVAERLKNKGLGKLGNIGKKTERKLRKLQLQCSKITQKQISKFSRPVQFALIF